MGGAVTADALLTRHAAAWEAATVHQFLAGVRDGSVPPDSFDRWLAQDYLFAQALLRAQTRVAAGAPLADLGLLAGAWSPSWGARLV
jgi:thiaminase/transcriptional activator TenA